MGGIKIARKRRTKQLLAAAAILAICAASIVIYRQSNPVELKDVPEHRLQKLTRGVNLSGWFWSHYDPWAYDSDKLQSIRDMGFLHVRLPFNSTSFYNGNDPAAINPVMLKRLDQAIENILSHDLAVVLDYHADDGLKAWIQLDPLHAEKTALFWESLAKHMRRFDPDLVFLEVLNEPYADDPQDWYDSQKVIMAAMRRGAPEHTLIASANLQTGLAEDSIDGIRKRWNSSLALTMMEPLKDRNVVYNFHMYDPMTFTHQEAGWGWEMQKYIKDVPYPLPDGASCPTAGESSVMSPEEATIVQAALDQYCREGWSKDKVREYLKPVVDWARSHDVPLTANEFGVYRSAEQTSRLRYIRDVREAFEEFGIGWTVWDYQTDFGVAPNGIPDRGDIEALGLQPVPGFWESTADAGVKP